MEKVEWVGSGGESSEMCRCLVYTRCICWRDGRNSRGVIGRLRGTNRLDQLSICRWGCRTA